MIKYLKKIVSIIISIILVTISANAAVVSDNELRTTVLFQIIAGEIEPDEGELEWGQTITSAYYPKDSNYLFTKKESLVE